MTFDKAFAIMKKGGTVFKEQNPDILYTAKFDDITKKYTLVSGFSFYERV